jgi:hypothetical protein
METSASSVYSQTPVNSCRIFLSPHLASIGVATLLSLFSTRPASADQPQPASPAPLESGAANTQDAANENTVSGPRVEQISKDVYQVGPVRIDRVKKTASFKAKVNQREGNLEYLLVTPNGSTHESLLVSDISPSHLHFAMLLLGVAPSPQSPASPPSQINADFLRQAPAPQGSSIEIQISWKDAGKQKNGPVEDWILNTANRRPAERGPWIYTGSYLNQGSFMAQLDGCLAALVYQPSALINNPREGRNDDSVWEPNPQRLPAAGTPVEVTFRLLTSSPSPQP